MKQSERAGSLEFCGVAFGGFQGMSTLRRSVRFARLVVVLGVPLALAACSMKFDPNGVMSNGLTNEGAGAIPPGHAQPSLYEYSQNGIPGYVPPTRRAARQGAVEETGFLAPRDLRNPPAALPKPLVHRSLPASAPQLANAGSRRTVVVKPGDSLVGIAFLTGSTVNDLMALNNLGDRRLMPGQRLLLP